MGTLSATIRNPRPPPGPVRDAKPLSVGRLSFLKGTTDHQVCVPANAAGLVPHRVPCSLGRGLVPGSELGLDEAQEAVRHDGEVGRRDKR